MSGTRGISDSSKKIVDAVSMAANINSTGVDLQGLTEYSIQAVYSGSPTGTLKLQISNDLVSDASLVTNWTDYTGSSVAISAAGNTMYKIDRSGERWARLVYTFSSGSGTLNVVLSAQG
jgi:hypothetical protein